MKTYLFGAPVLLALATPAMAQVMTPDEYVAAAGASDLYERQASQIVLQTTQDPKIKAFATMMITDHGKSTAKVQAAAAKSGVTAPPPALMPAQAEQISQLQTESGPARDATYVAQQKTSHDQALQLQKSYAMDGTAPALKAAAAGIVPVVQHHIDMLKSM